MDLSEAREVFMQECSELLDRMESLLIEESTNPRGERETIDSLFRVVHTIKGSAGIFGFDRIERFAHDLESLMDRVRGGEKDLNPGLVELLLRSRDHLSSLMQLLNVREESAAAVMGANLDSSQAALLAEVRAMIDGGAVVPAAKPQAAAPPASKENTYRIVLMFKPELFSHGLDPLPVVRNLRTCGEVLQFHLILDRLPALAAVSPETCYLGCEMILRSSLSEKELRSELEFVQDDCEISISEESAPTSPAVSGQAAKAAPAPASALAEPASSSFASDPSSSKPSPAAAQPSESRFVRVESSRLDHLVNLVGELVIQTAHLNQVAELSGNTDMAENSEMVYKIVSELRDHAFGLRMIPIGGIFSRFQRIVHDLKADLGKDVQLELRGQETELDKSLVERLFDPLLHLVRNSIDHGIEKPEERSAGGKPAAALLRLSARHEASEIIIEVQDDGRGLDTQKILARAKERGLVRADEILDTAEIQRLIFQPGFSTADAVTNLSGRGVGMDVVKREIQAMRGRIDIQSERGVGTLIRIRLPLTLAIIDGLCVRLGESFFIIPLDIVIECLEYDGSGEGGVMNLRGEVLPLLHTARLFNIPVQNDDKQNIVVVQHAGRKAGVVVQEIRGEVQSVIRPIGKMLGEVEGIGGSTILGDGAIALILDIPALAEGIAKQDRAGRHMVDLRTVGA